MKNVASTSFRLLLAMSLMVSLSASLTACQTSSAPVATQSAQSAEAQQAALKAKIDAQTELFDLMLLRADPAGFNAGIPPEDIESLKIDGKAVSLIDILLPGADSTENLKNEKNQLDVAAKVADGGTQLIYGGGSVYSFLIPQTDKNSLLEIKLKGDSQAYQLVRVHNLTRGTFVLDKTGVVGGFSTAESFSVKQEDRTGIYADDKTKAAATAQLYQIMLNPQAFFDRVKFGIDQFTNLYQTEGGKVSLIAFGSPISSMSVSPLDLNAPVPAKILTESDWKNAWITAEKRVGFLSPLLSYVGNWTLANDLFRSAMPGGKCDLKIQQLGQDAYRLELALGSGTYAGQGQHSGVATGTSLKLQVSAGDKSFTTDISLDSPNMMRVAPGSLAGIPELKVFEGSLLLSFKRKS